MKSDTLWVEKYRPQSLGQLVLSDTNRPILEQFLRERAIPQLLLVGIVGSGKTTTGKILIKAMDCAVLELNASDERGIDVVRNKIVTFLMSWGHAQWKVVFLDEADKMTADAQASLRNIMERFSEKGRFLLTANEEEGIIEPIRSRCQTLFFEPLDRKAVAKRVKQILDDEDVAYDVEELLTLIDRFYPDVRKIINTVQLNCINGQFKFSQYIDMILTVKEGIKAGNLRAIREMLAAQRPDYLSLYRSLFDAIAEDGFIPQKDRTDVALSVADYMYRGAMAVDREINFAACCLEIMKRLGRA